MMSSETIDLRRLQVGLYVELDLSWMDHPFLLNRFVIKNEKQLALLRAVSQRHGLGTVRYDPSKSDTLPLPEGSGEGVGGEVDLGEEELAMIDKKRRNIGALHERQRALRQCSSLYTRSVESTARINRLLQSQADLAVHSAESMVEDMITSLAEAGQVTLNLVNVQGYKRAEEFHGTNVAVLSIMLGQRLGLNPEELGYLGVGALLHDAGKQILPLKVREFSQHMSNAEQRIYRSHTEVGVDMLSRQTVLSEAVRDIIVQHHEWLNGAGYPNNLRQEEISRLARIVAICNQYDNLCNPKVLSRTLSPYQTTARLYADRGKRFDEELLSLFISTVGVYPPGTFVRLSDDRLGIVVSVRPNQLLKPDILVYEPQVPRKEAAILSLAEERYVKIIGSVRHQKMPEKAKSYLNPGLGVNYYFGT